MCGVDTSASLTNINGTCGFPTTKDLIELPAIFEGDNYTSKFEDMERLF